MKLKLTLTYINKNPLLSHIDIHFPSRETLIPCHDIRGISIHNLVTREAALWSRLIHKVAIAWLAATHHHTPPHLHFLQHQHRPNHTPREVLTLAWFPS